MESRRQKKLSHVLFFARLSCVVTLGFNVRTECLSGWLINPRGVNQRYVLKGESVSVIRALNNLCDAVEVAERCGVDLAPSRTSVSCWKGFFSLFKQAGCEVTDQNMLKGTGSCLFFFFFLLLLLCWCPSKYWHAVLLRPVLANNY